MSAPVVEAVVAAEATVCDAFRPDMVEAFGDATDRLCDARRTVLGCGGCACASMSEIAQTDPEHRAELGKEVRDLFVAQGGAE
jgi:hypothetical protein